MAEIQKVPHSLPNGDGVVPGERDQVPHLLIFLRSKALLKPAKPPIDSPHRLPCLFGDCGAGRSTSSDIEPVTTFSAETNWIVIATGWLIGMTWVSNRSNRRDRLLLTIFVVSVVRLVI